MKCDCSKLVCPAVEKCILNFKYLVPKEEKVKYLIIIYVILSWSEKIFDKFGYLKYIIKINYTSFFFKKCDYY